MDKECIGQAVSSLSREEPDHIISEGERVGAVLCRLGAVLGRSWGHPGRSWLLLGGLLGYSVCLSCLGCVGCLRQAVCAVWAVWAVWVVWAACVHGCDVCVITCNSVCVCAWCGGVKRVRCGSALCTYHRHDNMRNKQRTTQPPHVRQNTLESYTSAWRGSAG